MKQNKTKIISLRTGVPSISDLISKRRSSVFRHVARLPASAPAHQTYEVAGRPLSKDFPVPTGSAVPVVRTGQG